MPGEEIKQGHNFVSVGIEGKISPGLIMTTYFHVVPHTGESGGCSQAYRQIQERKRLRQSPMTKQEVFDIIHG